MFRKSKVIMSMVIIMSMLIAIPATVAANGVNHQWNENGFQFQMINNQITIIYYTGPSGAITIPRTTLNGQTVQAIGERAFQNANLTSVTFSLPSSINTIAREAFRWSNVNSITLPGSVNFIGEGAFRGTRLTQVTIPASVTRIDNDAFRDATNLRDAHFEHMDGRNVSMGSHIFTNTANNFRITHPVNATHFGQNWYPPHPVDATDAPFTGDSDWRWTNLTGNNIMITGYDVNSSLATAERIEIPSQIGGRTVRRIQGRAFDHHPNLREVVIPNTVTNIETRAFNNNRFLTSAYFLHGDGSNVELSADAFIGSHNSFSILYPYGARGFSTPTWQGFPARPADVEGIWEFTSLAGTNELMITRYNGTATVVEIPSVIEGRPVRYIGNDVIRGNTTITELIVPDSVVSIAANAVVNVPNLRVVRLRHLYADTLQLSGLAFSGFHRDFTIIFPGNATGFTTPTFVGFPAEPDLISANWEYTITAGAATITEYIGDEEHAEIPAYIGGTPVRVIASQAFRNNDTLLRVTIPANVTTIESNAFYNCRRLYAAHLLHTDARTLNRFARDSFVGVATYFRLIFPNNATNFTTPLWNGYFAAPESDALTIRDGDFEYIIRREPAPGITDATRDVIIITRYFGTSADVTIPSTFTNITVTAIGDFAFQQNRSVRRVVIPASVTSIGHSSFLGAAYLESARFLHTDGTGLTLHSNTFRYTASNFTILYPPASTGFSTPTWQGWPARPYTGAPPTTPGPGGTTPPPTTPGADGPLRNPLIHTTRVLDSHSPFMTRDGYVLQAPIFRLEPFAPNRQFSTSYVMVRVIADILGLDWSFNAQTNTATFSGYNAQNQFIRMELTINSSTMLVNGVPQEVRASAGVVPAISRDGRIFVPVMVFQEVFGVTIQWNGTNRTVTVNP